VGLGSSSLGGTPFGFGTPVASQAPPDPQGSAAFIDPTTKDHVVGDDGESLRMPITRQRVLLLLMTELGSSADPEKGLRLPDKIDQFYAQTAQQAVRDCLATLGSDIVINRIPVEILPNGRSSITVDYTDLTTGNSDTVTV
jgi:hypothetical protein